jgi:hypothetical protein
VKTELKRLAPSNRRPDAWQTSFLTVLANIYCTLTGKRRPSENDAVLNSLLAAATEDLGFRIDDWKQIRALLKRAQNDPSGSGFDRGRDGRFGMHSMTHVEQRGREIANLVSRIVDDGDSIASAIVGMRDESIISEVLILREIVLRPYLEREGLLTETLMVQLGWKDISANIVKEKLLEVINRAREGSAKAVATLALAHKTDNPAIKFMLHTARGAPFLFMSRDRVMKDLQPKAKRDVLAEVLWNLLSITDPNCKILGMAAQIRLSDEDPVAAKARDERYQKAEANYQEWKSKRTIGTSERIELSLLMNRSVSVVR